MIDELMINLNAQVVFCSVCYYSLVIVGLSVHDQLLCRVVLAVCLACSAKTSVFAPFEDGSPACSKCFVGEPLRRELAG